ncbi:hypothetical protein J0H58_34180 [bacterium]|nr:hypothetical protein [bacterium]
MTPPRWSVPLGWSISPNATARSQSTNVFPSTTVSAEWFHISTVGANVCCTQSGVWTFRHRLSRITQRSVSWAWSPPV